MKYAQKITFFVTLILIALLVSYGTSEISRNSTSEIILMCTGLFMVGGVWHLAFSLGSNDSMQ